MAEQGSKYSFIKKARQPDNQQTKQPANQTTSKPDNQKLEEQVKLDDQVTNDLEKQVNLCVKVPESWRRHWAAHSKLQGVTMTDVIVEALKQKFGLPDNQQTR